MDEECCPICIEPFDDQDRLFLPCACQYQVCMFCVRRILTEFDGRCPGCRSDYREENFRFRQLEADEVVRSRRQKAEKARQAEREKAKLAQQAKVRACLLVHGVQLTRARRLVSSSSSSSSNRRKPRSNPQSRAGDNARVPRARRTPARRPRLFLTLRARPAKSRARTRAAPLPPP